MTAENRIESFPWSSISIGQAQTARSIEISSESGVPGFSFNNAFYLLDKLQDYSIILNMNSQDSREHLLDTKQAAEYVGVKPRTLEVYRSKKKGPNYLKYSHGVRYRREDLDSWMEPILVQHEDRIKAERKRQGI